MHEWARSGRLRLAWTGIACALFALGPACHDPTNPPSPPTSTASAAEAPVPGSALAIPRAQDASLPPRCVRSGDSDSDLVFAEGAELGESVKVDDGFAFGVLRPLPTGRTDGRVAGVVRVGHLLAPETDLGPTWREAPAPQPFVHGTELYAVSYLEPSASAGTESKGTPRPRVLAVHHVGKNVDRLVELPRESDLSWAYDVIDANVGGPAAGALVAWDDRVGSPPKSVIRVAVLSSDLRTVKALKTFPSSTGAEDAATDVGDPRLVARQDAASGGYWLTWVARRLEHPPERLPLPAGEIETPSEESTYGWVNAVPLDGEGVAVGPTRALTSVTGHVSSYVVAGRESRLEIIAADEGAAMSPGGASLERVEVPANADPVRNVLVRAGVEEETAPSWSLGAGTDAWVSFVDVRGDTELVPLPGGRNPSPPTVEPLLAHGRLLGVGGLGGHDKGELTVVTAESHGWSLVPVTCAR